MALLRAVKGARDVESLCADSALDHSEARRSLWAFRVIGLVARLPKSLPLDEDGLEDVVGDEAPEAASYSDVPISRGGVRSSSCSPRRGKIQDLTPVALRRRSMTELVRADLSGRRCLVTGASAGIGKATATELARLGARVATAVRDAEKGEWPRREILGATGRADVELAIVDLASQATVRRVRCGDGAPAPSLDVLVNNAGVDQPPGEGAGRHRAHVGHERPRPPPRDRAAAAALRRAPRARIVNVASQLAGGLELDDVQYERRPTRAGRRTRRASRPTAC